LKSNWSEVLSDPKRIFSGVETVRPKGANNILKFGLETITNP
jgi:hypothetical protein